MRKKVITCILIFAILFQTITVSYGSDASEVFNGHEAESFQEIDNELTGSDVDDIYQEGSVGDKTIAATESSGPATASAITHVLTFIPWIVSTLMTTVATTGNNRPGEYSTTPEDTLTVQSLVFDRIELLNANYFAYNANTPNYVIKESVKNWYSGVRTIAIIASIVILIYMGIRMAISSLASDKAKYKKMFFDWLTSFIMVFVLHIIIIFMSNLSTSITYMLTENAGALTLETKIMEYRMEEISTAVGWDSITQTIIYFVLVFYQARFFIMYVKRFFTIGFLIVISPLITVSYAIDRAGDNRSQVFQSWGKELAVNLFIQPLHAFLYMVFMFIAEEIAVAAPIFAIIFLMALSRGEKIVKAIFNLRGMSTIHSMSETLKLKKKGG